MEDLPQHTAPPTGASQREAELPQPLTRNYITLRSILSVFHIPCSTDIFHCFTPGIPVFPLHTRPKQRLGNVKLLYHLSKPVQLISDG